MKQREEVKALFPSIPRRDGWRLPQYVVLERRMYRGRKQFVAGYSHSRIGAHFASGMVYDRILGWGETESAAISKMRETIERLRSKS